MQGGGIPNEVLLKNIRSIYLGDFSIESPVISRYSSTSFGVFNRALNSLRGIRMGTLDVEAINLMNVPVTSAGAYDILTRNTSTGVVEKKLDSDFVHTTGTESVAGDKTLSGILTVNQTSLVGTDSSINPTLAINGAASTIRFFNFRTASLNRWRFIADDTPESGSGVGSDLRLSRHNDAGVFMSDVLFIKRSTGNVLINSSTDSGVSTEKLQVNGTVVSTNAKITSLSGTGTRTVVADANGNLSATDTPPARPYKVYTALVTQTGTSAPVATVIENTLGVTVTFSYTSAGLYHATFSGTSAGTKFVPIVSNNAIASSGQLVAVVNTANNSFDLSSKISGTGTDSLISTMTLEYRIYP